MSSSVPTNVAASWREHAAILIAYAALAIAVSWPLAAHFTTALTGAGADALSHLWLVWHGVQAMAGREPFFSTSLLDYPAGTSLLLQSAGPFASVLALPFWLLGPVAGYNGGLVLALTLTGYAMYLLARDVGCSKPAALFAGAMLVTAPIHLVGLRGPLAAVFLGFMPLALLLERRALDERRSMWWIAPCAGVMLLTLLHSPLQFVQIAMLSPVIVVTAVWRGDARLVAKRTAILAVAAALACGPILAATDAPAVETSASIDSGDEPSAHAPDLVQFVMPPTFSALFGASVTSTLARWQVTPDIETEVSVPLVAIVLTGAALVSSASQAAAWIAVAIVAVLLSLGPTLHAFGVSHDGITLPCSWLAGFPGLGFLQTPGRFMQIGFVAIAAAAAIGLDGVAKRRPSAANALAATASLLLFLQVWPVAWPTETLPPTPALYTSLAADKTMFGILDLPVRPSPDISPYDYSARYQAYQMVHQKGIAAGSGSRPDARHPVSPCIFADDRAPADVRVDGMPSRCEPAAIYQLAAAGYRYVVWHKPSAWSLDNLPGSWADADVRTFVESAFGARPPAVDDVLVRVWTIPQGADALPALPVVELGAEWYPVEPEWRWTTSPATLTITAPRRQEVELTMSVPLLHDRSSGRAIGRESVLIATLGDQTVSRAVTAGEVVRFPLSLDAGAQTVSIALGAGNFTPFDYGETDARRLSFAVAWIDLVTAR